MTRNDGLDLKIGMVVGIKLPYLKHKYSAEYFPQVAVAVRFLDNNLVVVKDSLGNCSVFKSTELDILIKNN